MSTFKNLTSEKDFDGLVPHRHKIQLVSHGSNVGSGEAYFGSYDTNTKVLSLLTINGQRAVDLISDISDGTGIDTNGQRVLIRVEIPLSGSIDLIIT